MKRGMHMSVIAKMILEICVLLLRIDYEVGPAKTRTTADLGTVHLEKAESNYYFIIALLIYISYEDDRLFTIREKRNIRLAIRNAKHIISFRTRRELLAMFKTRIFIRHLFTMLDDYSIGEEDLKAIIKEVKRLLHKEIKYLDVISKAHIDLLAYY